MQNSKSWPGARADTRFSSARDDTDDRLPHGPTPPQLIVAVSFSSVPHKAWRAKTRERGDSGGQLVTVYVPVMGTGSRAARDSNHDWNLEIPFGEPSGYDYTSNVNLEELGHLLVLPHFFIWFMKSNVLIYYYFIFYRIIINNMKNKFILQNLCNRLIIHHLIYNGLMF